jgi:hypothetical protein
MYHPSLHEKHSDAVQGDQKAGVFIPTGIFLPLPAVRVYRSGINGIPLLTARIQNPNQNRLYKRYPAVYRGIKYLYRCGKDLYRSIMN